MVRNKQSRRQQRYEAKPNLGNKLHDRFLHNRKSRVPTSIRQTIWRNKLQIAEIIEYTLWSALPKGKKNRINVQ